MKDKKYKMNNLFKCPKCGKDMNFLNGYYSRHKTGGIVYKQNFVCGCFNLGELVERVYMLTEVNTITDPENTKIKRRTK